MMKKISGISVAILLLNLLCGMPRKQRISYYAHVVACSASLRCRPTYYMRTYLLHIAMILSQLLMYCDYTLKVVVFRAHAVQQ